VSLKLVPFETLGAVSYSPSIVTVAISVAVCEIFSVKDWCDLENRVRVCSRSLKMAPFDRSHTSSYSPSIITMAISCIRFSTNKSLYLANDTICIVCEQGHREFPFGNSREFGTAKFPAGIPGNFAKIAFGYFFPVISLFVQFHYHLQQTLSVNYNVLSINNWSIISIGTKLQFRNPLSGFGRTRFV